jgi:hypothetical protein
MPAGPWAIPNDPRILTTLDELIEGSCAECGREATEVVRGRPLCASHASAALQREDE